MEYNTKTSSAEHCSQGPHMLWPMQSWPRQSCDLLVPATCQVALTLAYPDRSCGLGEWSWCAEAVYIEGPLFGAWGVDWLGLSRVSPWPRFVVLPGRCEVPHLVSCQTSLCCFWPTRLGFFLTSQDVGFSLARMMGPARKSFPRKQKPVLKHLW